MFGTENLSAVAKAVLGGIITGGGWAFVLAASGFVIFAVYVATSRYGRIPLGRDDEAPEVRASSWIAMMFSAGMGIGLMFYGVAEPLAHFTSPPPGTAAPGSPEAFDVASRPTPNTNGTPPTTRAPTGTARRTRPTSRRSTAGPRRSRTADTSTSAHVVMLPDRTTRVCLMRHRLVW